MSYDLKGRALYSLSELFTSDEFPLASFFDAQELEGVFGGLYFTDAEAYASDGGWQVNFRLAFETELGLSPPGLPGVALVVAGAGAGWTSFAVSFVIGTEPSASLHDVPLTLRFARTLLKPMQSRTEEAPGPGVDIALGEVSFIASGAGFSIDYDGRVAIPLSMIGNTGVLVQADDVIVRLSPTVILPPEAATLGLASDWQGVYVGQASIWLPRSLSRLVPDQISLTHAFIGDGGFSGTVSVDWAPALTADLFGISVALEHLGITLALNALTELDLRGGLTFPALKDRSGNPAPITFAIAAGTTGYRIVGGDIPPLKLGGVELDLDRVEVAFDDAALKSVDIAGVLGIPGLKGADGLDAAIGFAVDYAAGLYTLSASSLPPLKLGPLALTIDSLDLSFDQNGPRSSALSATVVIPGLEAAQGGPAEIGVRLALGGDRFTVEVDTLPPLKLAALVIELDRFELSFGKNDPLTTAIAGRITLPNVKDAAGNAVKIAFDLEFEPNLFRIATTAVPAFTVAGATVQLTAFSLGFNAQGLVAAETTIAGSVRLPAFKNEAGGPLDIAISVDLSDGFEVTAQIPGGDLRVLDIQDAITVALHELSIGVGAAGVRFSIGGRIDNHLHIPFVEKLLPSTIQVNELSYRPPSDLKLDVALTWPNGTTAGSDGQGGFEVEVPIGEIGGGLSIDAIRLRLQDAGAAYQFGLTFRGATLELGPVLGTVDGLGIQATIEPRAQGGNLGPLELDLGVIPPTGIGLSIDTDSVKLAGFLGIEPDGYIGAAELRIQDSFGLSLVGLLTTRLPDGTQGISLLAIVSVELPSPIHIAYNIFFAGAGGLLGLNRSVDVDRLTMGLRTGAADNILFPKDVVRNIHAIATDLKEIFPPTRDQFVVGPMVLLTWSTPPLIRAKVGLIVEFPNPISIVILGALRAALPTEKEAILDLKVAFLGAIELDKGLIRFDASIYDSYIGRGDFKFSFEGDISLRISYGARKDFVNSVGGFHPLYSPPSYLRLPSPMRRVRVSLLKDNPRLSLSTYFAITSNTVQLGAELEFRFDVSAFAIVGDFGFDVLFQFNPFHFIAHVYASLAVKAGGADILTLKLDFNLEGTTPWIASGTATFHVLFWDVHAEFSKTFGEPAQAPTPTVPILPVLLKEFGRAENWQGALSSAADELVRLRELVRQAGEILLDGSATLRIAQSAIPLDMELERYGTAAPADAHRLVVQSLTVGGADQAFDIAESDFAPAAYRALSDTQKLQAKSFEQLNSGVVMREDTALSTGTPLARPLRYEAILSDVAPTLTAGAQRAAPNAERLGQAPADPADRFQRWAAGGVVARSERAVAAQRRAERRSAVSLAGERFAVVRSTDLSCDDDASGLTRSQAEERLARLGGTDHVVVPDYKRRKSA